MTLVVGLGNPTPKYELTRHNVGFMLIDELLKQGEFSPLGSSKFQGELYKKGSLLLLKPDTFMNLSGNSVKAVADFYKPAKIVVIHDDLDLAFGAVKFKNGGSSGGHNGLKSIDSLMGADYDRVRIGIGKQGDAAKWVLSNFSESELEILKNEILPLALKAVLALSRGSEISEVSAKFSQKPAKKGKENQEKLSQNQNYPKLILSKQNTKPSNESESESLSGEQEIKLLNASEKEGLLSKQEAKSLNASENESLSNKQNACLNTANFKVLAKANLNKQEANLDAVNSKTKATAKTLAKAQISLIDQALDQTQTTAQTTAQAKSKPDQVQSLVQQSQPQSKSSKETP